MRNPGGCLIISDPDAPTREVDTFTCQHCNRVRFVKAKQNPEEVGGLCKSCMGLICSTCVDAGTCTPWEKMMEKQEARYHALRSYGLDS